MFRVAAWTFVLVLGEATIETGTTQCIIKATFDPGGDATLIITSYHADL
jgi:hypothetical protein